MGRFGGFGSFLGCVLLAVGCGGDSGSSGSGGTASSAGSGATTSVSGSSASMSGASSNSASSAGTSASATSSATTTTTTMTTSSPTSGTSGGTATTGPVGDCGNAPGQLLLPSMPWNTPVTNAALASDSQAVIDYLQQNVQSNARFQIDFSINVMEADANTPKMPFQPTMDFYNPDCDPAPMPVPDGGHVEGESGYACTGGGDCHLIVIDWAACRLYEQWEADIEGSNYQGGCMAIWALDQNYDDTLRGDYCTSADAGGFPIASMLFSADEIAAGSIDHAIRFILPNDNIRAHVFVRPGTHSTPPTSGPSDAPPYAARLRLKPDTDISGLNPAAQVVAQALMTYGMILSDGGNITFTARADDNTTHTWDEVGLGAQDLKGLQWSDFEVIDGGPTESIDNGDCTRTPITN